MVKVVNNLNLNMFGLPIIRTLDDLSQLTHISVYTIFQLSKNSGKHYKTYNIPKKSGGSRKIAQPSKKLKGLQGWILVHILDNLNVSDACKGFEKNTSIADNARPHIGANVTMTLDLKDFFPSIKANYIHAIFRSLGYNSTISSVLTNICTFNGRLPQGGPCSPKLANLATWRLDLRIQGYVGKRGITYTRYADDLTFSGLKPNNVTSIYPMIKRIIEDEKFKINNKKTRVAGASRAKRVTGLIINTDSFGIGKKKYKILRAKIHHLTKISKSKKNKLFEEVKGWLAYLNSVDQKRYASALRYIKKLSSAHPTSLVSTLIPVDPD